MAWVFCIEMVACVAASLFHGVAALAGRVTLVGAGVGEVGSLTTTARDLLLSEHAVVVADRGLSQSVLGVVRGEVVWADHDRDLEDLVLSNVRQGRDVVRVLAGDPYLFGRGAQEVLEYKRHGITPTVVPGIPAALAAPLSALVPLTHRDIADQVLLVSEGLGSTGQERQCPPYRPGSSLVFVNAMGDLPSLCSRLLETGYPDLWAAAVEGSGTPEQHAVIGSLTTLPGLASDHSMAKSSVVIVGDCVRAIHAGSWTGALPERPPPPPPGGAAAGPPGGGGSVTLVGAGPGDPGLLTLDAREALENASLVVADRLVDPGVLALVKGELKVPEPKKGGAMDAVQETIYRWVLEGVQRGERVVRLKIGDPFVFGRGGEEVLEYRGYGVEPRVIPGVSSAAAAPLLGGIALTHPGVAERVLLCSGYGKGGSRPDLPPWVQSSTSAGGGRRRGGAPGGGGSGSSSGGSGISLVFLMAVGRLGELATDLGRLGWPGECGAAVVERAATPAQRVVSGTLEDIAARAEACGVRAPAVVVVGDCVSVLDIS